MGTHGNQVTFVLGLSLCRRLPPRRRPCWTCWRSLSVVFDCCKLPFSRPSTTCSHPLALLSDPLLVFLLPPGWASHFSLIPWSRTHLSCWQQPGEERISLIFASERPAWGATATPRACRGYRSAWGSRDRCALSQSQPVSSGWRGTQGYLPVLGFAKTWIPFCV